jgi:streptomycin 6-kinase
MIDIPARFVRGTIEREGEPGRAWLATLPGLIEEFLQRWRCTPAGPMMHGGVGAVVPVQRDDGSPTVLKISFTHPGNVYEPDAFAAWRGHGALLLYERDDAHFAMLLERAGRDTLACLNDDAAIATCGEILRRLAVPGPPHLPRLSDHAAQQEESVRQNAERFGHPVPARVVDAALATIQDLYYKQPDTLVHGDLHYGNVLRARPRTVAGHRPQGLCR